VSEKTNLLDFTLPALTEWFAAQGEKPFRARQVFKWIHQRGVADFDAMTDLAKSLREKLKAIAEVKPPAILSEHRSSDGTVKWLFDVGVGNGIETVYIPEDDRGTLCVSSQAGCAVGCRFCSTGHQGFSRNLTTAEITAQLWFAEHKLRQRFTVTRTHVQKLRIRSRVERLLGQSVERQIHIFSSGPHTGHEHDQVLVPMRDKVGEAHDHETTSDAEHEAERAIDGADLRALHELGEAMGHDG